MVEQQGRCNRREFIGLGVATLAAARLGAAGKAKTDRNLSVFLSDIHLGTKGKMTGWGEETTYQNDIFDAIVKEILAMRPLPARVVIFGDLAIWFGFAEDYQAALPGVKKLEAAGIEVIVTAGNHDHRTPLFEAYPRQKEKTPVPGRLVSVVDLGTADLILLDTLCENTQGGVGAGNPAGGGIDDAQWKWFSEEVKARTRPFFVGSHHPLHEIGGRDVRRLLTPVKNFVGWIHGHEHVWSKRWFLENWQLKRYCRVAGLPALISDDIGYATLRTGTDGAELCLEQRDFFFPKPAKPGAKRPAIWDRVVAENKGQRCHFAYEA